MDNEIQKIEIAQSEIGSENLSFSLYKSTKEVLATYVQGEVEV